jgi:hypothetical protein
LGWDGEVNKALVIIDCWFKPDSRWAMAVCTCSVTWITSSLHWQRHMLPEMLGIISISITNLKVAVASQEHRGSAWQSNASSSMPAVQPVRRKCYLINLGGQVSCKITTPGGTG